MKLIIWLNILDAIDFYKAFNFFNNRPIR
uniref:Uncharacterized protein n=1 Tax=Enterococcus faecium TaxID=1352 RepID=B5U8R8_ENTFC|nr:hypothetical protein [Enterococcus faecium]